MCKITWSMLYLSDSYSHSHSVHALLQLTVIEMQNRLIIAASLESSETFCLKTTTKTLILVFEESRHQDFDLENDITDA